MYYLSRKLVILVGIVILYSLPFLAHSQSSESLAQELNQKLQEINAAILSYRSQIKQLGKTNLNLQGEIGLLEKRNQTIELQIKAGELALQELKMQAAQLEGEISILQDEITEAKEKLSESITQLYQYDQRSNVEMFFSGNEFSDFFDQIHYLKRVQDSVKNALSELSSAKELLDNKEEELGQRLASQERLLVLQNLEQEEIENNKKRKDDLISKNVQVSATLSQKSSALQIVASQLQQKLYIIKGLAGSVSLSSAYQQAQVVASRVGIDPNFLMAILKVESDLGNNIGKGNWQKDMHPRDREAFAKITQTLGLDPNTTPVSAKPKYGWGGAMGPAQFLPSVWLGYEERIANLTGHNPPNPWVLEDAFAAAAIKLSANGANKKNPEGEWEAAMKYFAGSRWQSPAYVFYGDRVMAVKELIAEST